MANSINIRKWLCIIWLISLAVLWGIFSTFSPGEIMTKQLNLVERSIATENWNNAKEQILVLNKLWKKYKTFIQVNNGTEEIWFFERTLAQVKTLIQHEEDDVIDHIGELRDSISLITQPFPGP